MRTPQPSELLGSHVIQEALIKHRNDRLQTLSQLDPATMPTEMARIQGECNFVSQIIDNPEFLDRENQP